MICPKPSETYPKNDGVKTIKNSNILKETLTLIDKV